jgi:hypothetical protein
MDRDPNRRPATAGELLDRLEDALVHPQGGGEPRSWLQPAMHRGSIGLSALLVLLVGAAEAAWLLDGTGLSLLVKLTHQVFGH